MEYIGDFKDLKNNPSGDKEIIMPMFTGESNTTITCKESHAIKVNEAPKDLIINCRTITLRQGEFEMVLREPNKRLGNVNRIIVNGIAYKKEGGNEN